MKKYLFTLFLFIPLSFFAAMNGTYTVGHPGTGNYDYCTISDAITALENNSVNGPVTIKIYDGTYTEQLHINPIGGVSSTNTIKFISKSGNANNVILKPINNNIQILSVYCDYITFEKVTFTVDDNIVYGILGYTISDFKLVKNIFNSSSSDGTQNYTYLYECDDMVVKGNYFDGSGIDVALEIIKSDNVKVKENEIENSATGVNLYSQAGALYLEIKDNVITDVTNGILINNFLNPIVLRNKIIASHKGIHVLNNYAFFAHAVTIRNNMVSILDIDTHASGIYVNLTGTTEEDRLTGFIEHNSVCMIHNSDDNVLGAGYIGAGIDIETASNEDLKVRSNSVKLIGPKLQGIMYNFSSNGDLPDSDYNNVFRVNGNGISTWGVYHNLNQIKLALGTELHSISKNPKYVSNTDLHINATSFNINKAFHNVSVTMDIDKQQRFALTPFDIGADELPLVFKSSSDEEKGSLLDLTLFPNPAVDYIQINFDGNESEEFKVYNLDGRLVLQGPVLSGETINVSQLAKGNYVLMIPTIESSSMFTIE